MRVMLFGAGKPGVAARLLGELKPEEKFALRLRGNILIKPVGEGAESGIVLLLVRTADAEERGEKENYTFRRTFVEDEPVFGDCLVTAVNEEGEYIDMTDADKLLALRAVVPVGEDSEK